MSQPPRPPQISGLCDQLIELPRLIDEVPIGILVVDPSHRVILMNRSLEVLTGMSHGSVQGTPCYYVLRSNLCMAGCPVRELHKNSGPVSAEADIINRGRQKIPVRFTAAPLIGKNGKLVGYVKSVEDMRFFKKPEDQAAAGVFGKLIGNSPEMQRVFRVLPTIAQTDSSVLITGQTGTGKDYVAEAIHYASRRAKGPFIKVNCGALPEGLLESELFGHQKGAFTGAVENKPGRFRLAHNGTLYLTEIGDLPLHLQVKLLSFLDDKVVYPLGSSKGIHVDVRVIAATHRNLEEMVRQGQFRADLLFRLNVLRLHLPSLSERGDDIRMLTSHFLRTFNSRFSKKISKFSDTAEKVLMNHHFPGNVRELRNMVEYAVNLCDGDRILPEHLPDYLTTPRSARNETPEREPEARLQFELQSREIGENVGWAETERRMILEAMIKAKGNRSKAAKYLGLGRSTLWRKMKQYQILS
ncbi:MAG: sigma 54-interacting transcriptional regulator [Thermodesulfobacteriota bacterium]